MKHLTSAIAASLLTVFALAPTGLVPLSRADANDQFVANSQQRVPSEQSLGNVPPLRVAQLSAHATLVQDDSGSPQENADSSGDDANSNDNGDQNNADANQNGDAADNGSDADQNAQTDDSGDNGGDQPGYAGDSANGANADQGNGDGTDSQSDSADDSTDQNGGSPMDR